VKCGKVELTADPDATTRDKVLSELPPGVLKAFFPALGALLESPLTTGAAVFFGASEISKDAFQLIDNAGSVDVKEVAIASRRMLLDTKPEAMRQLSRTRQAVILVCGHRNVN
jgi:hypothetical protein